MKNPAPAMFWPILAIATAVSVFNCKQPPAVTKGTCEVTSYSGADVQTQDCKWSGYVWHCTQGEHVFACARDQQLPTEAQ